MIIIQQITRSTTIIIIPDITIATTKIILTTMNGTTISTEIILTIIMASTRDNNSTSRFNIMVTIKPSKTEISKIYKM